ISNDPSVHMPRGEHSRVKAALGREPSRSDVEDPAWLGSWVDLGELRATAAEAGMELERSEEHTSELQSRFELVCRLLLEKKKGEPSEMALLSRLHWWTVEYGLIGTLDKPKIYGAGLLSSIGESVSCLEANVKKIPYSIDAQNTPFDITTRQPQLFVCRDFNHLRDVLEECASTMADRVGGLGGINKAIECNNIATCEYSSGLQVSGVFSEVLTDESRQSIYFKSKGPTALAFRNKELSGHGKDRHAEGF